MVLLTSILILLLILTVAVLLIRSGGTYAALEDYFEIIEAIPLFYLL